MKTNENGAKSFGEPLARATQGAVPVRDILQKLSVLAPPDLAEPWDNVGLLVDAGRPASKVMTALDITPEVVQEASQQGCQLIASHHPVIFHPLKNLNAAEVPALLLAGGISAVCMHTNLDAAEGGVNDTLARLLNMQDTQPFAQGCGRIGTVTPTTVGALAEFCTKILGAHCKLVEPNRSVRCLAEVSGSGGSFFQEAADLGADCLITGEASHHDACDANRLGLGLIVAGHWATEHPIAGVLADYLRREFPQLQVLVAQSDRDPFTYLETNT